MNRLEMHASSVSIWLTVNVLDAVINHSKYVPIENSISTERNMGNCYFDSMSRRSIFRIYQNKFIPRIDIRVRSPLISVKIPDTCNHSIHMYLVHHFMLANGHYAMAKRKLGFRPLNSSKTRFQFYTVDCTREHQGHAIPFRCLFLPSDSRTHCVPL